MALKYLAPTIPVTVCAKWTGSNIGDLQDVSDYMTDHNPSNYTDALIVTNNGNGTVALSGSTVGNVTVNVNDWLVALPVNIGHYNGGNDEIRAIWYAIVVRADDPRAQYLTDNVTNGRGTWQVP